MIFIFYYKFFANDISTLSSDISAPFGMEISLFGETATPNSDISVPNGA